MEVLKCLFIDTSHLIEHKCWADQDCQSKDFQVNISWTLWRVESLCINQKREAVFITLIHQRFIPHPYTLGARFYCLSDLEAFHLIQESVHQETLAWSIRSSHRYYLDLFLSRKWGQEGHGLWWHLKLFALLIDSDEGYGLACLVVQMIHVAWLRRFEAWVKGSDILILLEHLIWFYFSNILMSIINN